MKMSNNYEYSEAVAFICFMLLFITLVFVGIFHIVANEPGQPIVEQKIYATEETWHSDAPPAGEPVIGLWYDGWEPRSHVIVMVMGTAYPYRLGGEAVAAVEHEAPVFWRRLP